MEKYEQRFVIKFVWMRYRAPSGRYQKLQHTLGPTAYNEDSVENRLPRFVSGNTGYADLPRAGRSRTDLSGPLRKFLNGFPFATTRMMSRQFSAHPIMIKEIFRRYLGLKKFARRWLPYQLNPSQKVQRVEAAKLSLLGMSSGVGALPDVRIPQSAVIECESAISFKIHAFARDRGIIILANLHFPAFHVPKPLSFRFEQ
jgi:hypothetical protein